MTAPKQRTENFRLSGNTTHQSTDVVIASSATIGQCRFLAGMVFEQGSIPKTPSIIRVNQDCFLSGSSAIHRTAFGHKVMIWKKPGTKNICAMGELQNEGVYVS
ncbi:MAG TPA: hypothetical protein VLC98_06285 [Phnomibacter sp.]|nr:hypothetical protein [Phnomibacter sp.]